MLSAYYWSYHTLIYLSCRVALYSLSYINLKANVASIFLSEFNAAVLLSSVWKGDLDSNQSA